MAEELLTARLQQELVAALREERVRLLAGLKAGAAAERALAESQAAEGDIGDSSADVASDLTEEEVDLALRQMERERLREVDAALARATAGRYGRCEGCGAPIAGERLFALPWTRWCLACAQQRDGARGAPTRAT